MKRIALCCWLLGAAGVARAVALPRASAPVAVTLPDFGADLRAFDGPQRHPVNWWPYVVNAAWGGGRGAPERMSGWLAGHWELVDYLDRSSDYTTHQWLTHRGIWYEVYGSNEYQETIHFHEQGAKRLFWDDGIARDMNGERVLSPQYNTSVPWWKERVGWDAYIVCNNAPRWSAVIDYDWLTSPLLGFAISQDNIGGPTSRIGAGSHGRYCDYCNARFFHYLENRGRLPEFRRRYRHIRDYVRDNLMDVIHQTPPYVRPKWDLAQARIYAELSAPPVMSEYLKCLYLSHLHNFTRYYRDAKLIASRLGREYDVHGNQGGGAVGPNPYQVALADFVDTIWFESSGITAYDQFQHHWYNANGAFRYVIGQAMTRGRKPFMSMTRFLKDEPDLVEHELAEACAGGGTLFVNQRHFAKRPDLLQKLTDYYRFRHQHRALFALRSKSSCAQVGVVYSIPSMLRYSYAYANAPPISAQSGIARALEEEHIPYDVVILNHPEIHADHVSLAELRRYRLLILPSIECLSDAQAALLESYLASGGVLGIIGECGVRDEDNRPRDPLPVPAWRNRGRVVDILPPGKGFFQVRATESEATRALTRRVGQSVRAALAGQTLLSGDLPRTLWVKAWRHGEDCVSLHFVNYDVDFDSGRATPTTPTKIAWRMPRGLPAEEAAWLRPGAKPVPIVLHRQGDAVEFTIPAVRVYGVVVIGRRGLDAAASRRMEIAARVARAETACRGHWADLESQAQSLRAMAADSLPTDAQLASARALAHAVQVREDAAYIASVEQAAAAESAMLALDFGATDAVAPWQAVQADTAYTSERGFGWLPPVDDTDPMPEELYYDSAQRHGQRYLGPEPAAQSLLFWPYRKPVPPPLKISLGSGARRSFRIDARAGRYRVRVVTTNPAWMNRNFLVSGMVAVNGAVYLLDAAHDRGAVVSREFTVTTQTNRLDFAFGGPTAWAVCAMVLWKAADSADQDRQSSGGLRTWRVSPRFANPQWYPITQVACPPERRLDSLAVDDWQQVRAPESGLPVIDLGTNREADTGDIVYAVTTIDSPAARSARLHFGASSQAQLWLNGQYLAYVPNEKGIRRDELVVSLALRSGANQLVVKLQRFWERRWLFYATVDRAGHG